jgi:hypothetical protein
MKHDGRRDPVRPAAGENARGFRLDDVFGAFWRPGAEALHIRGREKSPPQEPTPDQAGCIMPPAPAEPEEETR